MRKKSLAETHPYLVIEWHPTKNGELTPWKVTAGSGQKVWWHLPYDDPETGKHFEFEWEDYIINRADKNYGCPFISGKRVWSGYNDLASRYPEIALQWHPTKNGKLGPEDVTAGSHKRVWWCLPYDDPETGKHFEFEWEDYIYNRTCHNLGCPFIRGKRVWSGYNDLASRYPEIALQWHPTKNGELTPWKVTAGSGQKVWWHLPYDDPETGKHFEFEWEDYIHNRTCHNLGCPFISGHKVWPGYNDLASRYPEIAAQWHPTKNGKLGPEDVTSGSGKRVWWCLPYDDLETGKHFDFEWEEYVYVRTNKNCGCPFISGQRVWPGYNDLASLYPEIAMQWHPTKNGNLRPEDVTAGVDKKVWWYLPYDDPETGKHFDFEWEARINDRTGKNYVCPFIRGKRVWPGYNDLASLYPEIAMQWHPTKNGNLRPEDVTAGVDKKVWWYLPYDDPESGKHFDFEWQAYISSRTGQNCGCPFTSGQGVWIGYNDLASLYPEIAMQWHPAKNGRLRPENVTVCSGKKVWWYLPYDDPETGKHFDFEWEECVYARTGQNSGCPFISSHRAWPGYNDLASLYPEIAMQWHPTKNGKLSPEDVTAGSKKRVWWCLSYDDPETGKHFEFEWKAYVYKRTGRNDGCPYISSHKVWPGYNDLASRYPEIAAQWHPSKNGKKTPKDVYKHSKDKYWWLCPICGKAWRGSVKGRTVFGVECSVCRNHLMISD